MILWLFPLFLTAQNSADWVFHHGKIYTVDKNYPWAEAVAVKDSLIVFVGNEKDCNGWIGKNTHVVDLNGGVLMPGFIDGHNHFLSGCSAKRGLSLVGIYGKQKIFDCLNKYVQENPSKTLYMGYGWTFPAIGKTKINRHDLDRICSNKPVFLFNEDSHVVLFNTKAMEMGGISKNTKNPSETSYYEREPDQTPSGVAVESESYMPIALAIGVVGGKEMLLDIINEIFPELPRYGITSFYDMGIWAPQLSDGNKGFELLMEWEKAGKLHHRMVGVMGVRDAELSPVDYIDTLMEWSKKYHSKLISIRSVKLWADGTPDTHTGVQLEPYSDKPETSGESPWTKAILEQWIESAYRSGFDVQIHAMGDGSVRRSLDAFEAVEMKMDAHERRSGLHHINVIHPDDLGRFKPLNIGGNATLEWLTTYWDQSYTLFTKEKVEKEYDIWNRLDTMGVNITYGSDLPGTNPDEIYPLYQMQTALTGKVPYMKPDHVRSPDRVPSLEQMIKGYTLNGAYAMHLEKRIGSIETGKLADLIVLDKNPFDVKADKLNEIKIDLTMMNGKVIFSLMPVSSH